MKRNVKVMLTKLHIMLADFHAVIGHSSDMDQKRSGIELILTSVMELGTNPSDTPCFQRPWKRRITEQKRVQEDCPFQR